MSKSEMIDLLSLIMCAGDGGKGKISFRREKYVPKGGPDGGDGGDGGDIFLEATDHLSTLSHLVGKKFMTAKSGEAGGYRKRHGAKAKTLVIQVPVGTRVIVSRQNQASNMRESLAGKQALSRRDIRMEQYFAVDDDRTSISIKNYKDDRNNSLEVVEEAEEVLPNVKGRVYAELTKHGERLLLCQGGIGGRGNTFYKSSRETTPQRAELGSLGECKEVWLELRLLADIGLVGEPNVGKSTLLSVLTLARPKIADYPFTTLEPQLGILKIGDSDLVLADIPGLILGASEGRGLGSEFLRHVAHCSGLCFVLGVDQVGLTESLSSAQLAKYLWNQYQVIREEILKSYPDVLNKPHLIVLGKSDLYLSEQMLELEHFFRNKGQQVLFVSSANSHGVDNLKKSLLSLVR